MKNLLVLTLSLFATNAQAEINWNFDLDESLKAKVESSLSEECGSSYKSGDLNAISYDYSQVWYDTAFYKIYIGGSDIGGAPDYEVEVTLASYFAEDGVETFEVAKVEDIEGTCK